MPDFLSSLSGSVSQAITFVNEQTTTLSGVGGAIGSAVNVAEQIPIIGGTFSSTVGSVLSNGFNLSCWGASLTPQKAQDRLKVTYQPYFASLLSKLSSAGTPVEKMNALNQLMKEVYVIHYYYTVKKITEADWSSCAKTAINDVYKPFFNQMKLQVDNILSDFISQGASKTMRSMIPIDYTIPSSLSGDSKDYFFKHHDNLKKDWGVDYPFLTSLTVTQGTTSQENLVAPDGYHTAVFGPKGLQESEDVIKETNEVEDKSPSLLSIALGALTAYKLFN